MSSFPRHPEEELLLGYIDGELPSRKARQVRRHLEACWQCRAEVEELQKTVADCVRYRKTLLAAQEPPPQPWPDLSREFARMDASMARESLWARVMRPRWAAAALAAAAVILAVVYELREAPSVQAATLLKRAVAAAQSAPQPVRRVEIRTRTQRFTRTIGRKGGVTTASAAPAIQAMFQSAHYDWDDPLSARSYQAWRDGVPDKRDEVATVPDPKLPAASCYRIQTIAAEGDLAAASLTLRTTDLHPIEGRLEFRDQEWVELTEIADASTPDDVAISVVNPVEHSMRPAEPSRPAAVTPGPSASISDELKVLSVLHEIGADLGDPVQVQLSEGRVVVGGMGIAAQRQRQIHELLDSRPNVVVQFSEPLPPPAAPETPPPSAVGAAAPHNAAAGLEEQLGGHAEFAAFSSQVLDWNDKAMAHGYALRKLAQSFPAVVEAGLNPEDRQLLRDMAREHTAAMTTQWANIRRVLIPVLTSLGGSAPEGPGAPSATQWQPAAEDLFRASRRVEVLLSILLGVAPGEKAGADLPSQVLSAANQLRADVDHCHFLLARQ